MVGLYGLTWASSQYDSWAFLVSQENKIQVNDIVVTTSQKSCRTSFTELCWSGRHKVMPSFKGKEHGRYLCMTEVSSSPVGKAYGMGLFFTKQTKHYNMQRKRIKRYTNISRCLFLVVASLAVYFFLLCFLFFSQWIHIAFEKLF